MSGIIGYIGNKRVVPVLLEGLQRLQYRGYDSAGLAVMRGQPLDVRRVHRQAAQSGREDSPGSRGRRVRHRAHALGHARRPTEENAHPHRDCHQTVAVVHNGIIENYLELKKQLEAEGHKFTTETDTEVIAHLVEKHLSGRCARGGLARQPRRRRARGGAPTGGSVRARHYLHQRPEQDRRRAPGAAGGDRPGQGRILCGQRRPRHPLSHARPVLSFRRRRGRDHSQRRDLVAISTAIPSRGACSTSPGTPSWRRRAASSTSR